MEFEWDENKNQENQRKHGISFQKAAKIFEGRVLRKVDNRRNYGEERISALGKAACSLDNLPDSQKMRQRGSILMQ